MTTLYRVGKGHYCGPTTLAAITGEPAEQMVAEINRLRRRPDDARVVGSTWHELRRVLRARGYVTHLLRLPPGRSRVIDFKDRLGWSSVHIIETTTHFLALRDGLVVDTDTPNGEWIERHRARRQYVERIALIHPPKKG